MKNLTISEKLDIVDTMLIEYENWFSRTDFSDDIESAMEELCNNFRESKNKEFRVLFKRLEKQDESFVLQAVEEILTA